MKVWILQNQMRTEKQMRAAALRHRIFFFFSLRDRTIISRFCADGYIFACSHLVQTVVVSYIFLAAKGFVGVAQYLLQQPGVEYILSEKFNQDKLESLFGNFRQMQGGHEAPSVADVNIRMNVARQKSSQQLHALRGNTFNKASVEELKIDDTPMVRKGKKRDHSPYSDSWTCMELYPAANSKSSESQQHSNFDFSISYLYIWNARFWSKCHQNQTYLVGSMNLKVGIRFLVYPC